MKRELIQQMLRMYQPKDFKEFNEMLKDLFSDVYQGLLNQNILPDLVRDDLEKTGNSVSGEQRALRIRKYSSIRGEK